MTTRPDSSAPIPLAALANRMRIPVRGISNAALYDRFSSWLKSSGEREVSKEVMSRRLAELGWILFRLPRSQGQAKAYSRQTKVASHTVHTRAQSTRDDAVCTPVHGVSTSEHLVGNGCAP